MTLYCPKCKAPEIFRNEHEYGITVIFACFFSATFDKGLTDEQMQEKLNRFLKSGKMYEWLKKPFPS